MILRCPTILRSFSGSPIKTKQNYKDDNQFSFKMNASSRKKISINQLNTDTIFCLGFSFN